MAVAVAVVGAVVRHPSLWSTAFAEARRLVPRRWWARPPFLPLPDRHYIRFRVTTQYGGEGRARPSAGDVVTYLGWCRAMRAIGG